MTLRVLRISPLQAAKVAGVANLIIGGIAALLITMAMLLQGMPQGLQAMLALSLPLLYGSIGFAVSLVFCLVFNWITPRVGGIAVEFETEVTGSTPRG
jgi:O-antigen/teichoic acid export membrane protein